jgi:hypothetical protein
MDQEKHKTVMGALSELIKSQLEGEDRHRFASVKRLAVIAQKLMMEMGPRAGDAQANADFENGDFGERGMGVYNGIGGALIGGGGDQQQMVRETMAMMAPMLSGLQGQTEGRRRESVARELNELLDARGRLSMPVPGVRDGADEAAIVRLTKRIDAILAAMEEEEKTEGDEDGIPVVSAVDVRRHQADEGHRVIDAAYVDGARPDGEACGALALRARDEAGGAPDGVGHGG